MNRSLLLTIAFIIATSTLIADDGGLEIKWGQVRLIKLTPEGKVKIEALEKKESTRLVLRKEATQADFETLKGIAGFKTFETEYGNESITSIAPLAGMTSLESVTLSAVEKSKDKPIDLAPLKSLANLTELDCYATRVTNTDALASLTKLKKISFYMSAVESLEFLRKTTEVEKLDLYGFAHTFKDYKAVLALKKLKVLNIYMNKTATDELLLPLSAMTTLEEIESANNGDITNLDFLLNCKNMKDIDMKWCRKLSDIRAVSAMKNLEALDIDDSLVTDLKSLKGLKKLRRVSFSGTKIADLSPLKDCIALADLSMEETEVTDLTPLQGMVNLDDLELDKSAVTSLKGLEGLPKLRDLSFSETAIADLTPIKDCKKMSTITMRKTKVMDLSPLQGLEELRRIDLQGTAIIDLSPLKSCEKLSSLSVPKTVPQDQIDALKAVLPKINIKVEE